MQPYIFPYVGYFQLIHSADVFVFYDDVHFIKKGWINRNQILLNQEAFKFTIPLIGASQNKLINEIDVFWESNFDKKLLQQIEQSYRNAPHFNQVFELIQQFFAKKPIKISDLAILSVQQVCDYIGLKRVFLKSSELAIEPAEGRAERLMQITKYLDSHQYINAVNGQELYDKEYFKRGDIQLNFLSPILSTYNQGASTSPFVPYLSILDLLMWVEKEDILSLISSYEII